MVINIEIITIIIKIILNITEYIKPIINNLMTLMKVFIYIINHLNLPSLHDIFNNIYKTLLIINDIVKIIITIYTTAKFLYIIIIKLVSRLQNK